MSRIAFVDTETTGLSLDDEIWEFAAIVREEDGSETTCHMFIEHDPAKCNRLPRDFLADHRARFPQSSSPQWHDDVVPQEDAAMTIAALLGDNKTHIVGCVPNFDTERLALLLRRFGMEPRWHYHLLDVENLAVGWLNGVAARAIDEAKMRGEEPPRLDRSRTLPPWDSEAISRAVGVDPDRFERHTALGDVRWAAALFDAVTGETR